MNKFIRTIFSIMAVLFGLTGSIAQETTIKLGSWPAIGSKCDIEVVFDASTPQKKSINMICMDRDIIDLVGFYNLKEKDLVLLQGLLTKAIWALRDQ